MKRGRRLGDDVEDESVKSEVKTGFLFDVGSDVEDDSVPDDEDANSAGTDMKAKSKAEDEETELIF